MTTFTKYKSKDKKIFYGRQIDGIWEIIHSPEKPATLKYYSAEEIANLPVNDEAIDFPSSILLENEK